MDRYSNLVSRRGCAIMTPTQAFAGLAWPMCVYNSYSQDEKYSAEWDAACCARVGHRRTPSISRMGGSLMMIRSEGSPRVTLG